MPRPFLSPWRCYLVAFVLLASFGGILARLVMLQVVEADHLAEMALRSRRVTVPLMARRGDIIDARGQVLAATKGVVDLGVDPSLFRAEQAPRLKELAALLQVPEATLRTQCLEQEPQVRWVKLAEIDEQTYLEVEALGLKGIYGNRRYARYYPGDDLAAHLLGYLNRDGQAVSGVEALMDFYLRGQDGWKQTERDGARRELVAFREREVTPRAGFSVELTVDALIQDKVREEIAKLVAEFKPAGVTIIVSEAKSGALLALENYPSFDPNQFWKYPLDAHRNRAVTDLYEPGSTFKIVPVAAALEEHLVRPETLVDCGEAVVDYAGRRIRLPTDTHELGIIPIHEVVAHSSNRGAARVGMLLGEDRLYNYSRAFGFGQKVGWPLGAEVGGVLHPVKAWDGLTISRLPAGYAVAATPLQVHQAMSVIANEGVRVPPFLLSSVRDSAGQVVFRFHAPERERVLSEETARTMAAMLEGVVSTEGTARRAAITGFPVAGKTGTSRKIIDGQYSTNHHVASFSGFFPVYDPRFVITVVVDDAQNPGVAYGGVVAAPVFRAIGEWLVRYYQMEPEPSLRPFMARGGQP